jgi:hypothetical protein
MVQQLMPYVSWLPVTLLIRADEFCIGQHVALHCSLDLRFRTPKNFCRLH